jgi:hypothetical protein
MQFSRSIAPVLPPQPKRPALVIAHPGHELKVFGWASRYRVLVHVITDGSGRTGISRMPSTRRVLNSLGAETGEILGAFPDGEIYRAILEEDAPLFLSIVDTIASSFIAHDVDLVAGDASEGFNPTHDMCRMLVNAAVEMVHRRSGRRIANYEFCLTEWEQGCQEIHDERCWHVRLEDALLQRKLEAARAYDELRDEVRHALASQGEEHFRTECLKRVQHAARPEHALEKPFYEIWGERRVAQGEYGSVIRYEKHMTPLQHAIDDHVKTARRALTATQTGF